MIKKLFWLDPYKTECPAVITSVENNAITIDQTIFYAFSGGQASDIGSINNFEVFDAVATEDDILYKFKDPINFKVGDSVVVKIDKEHRLRIMRLHSAAHIVYEFFIKVAGNQKLIGSNLHADKARLDFEMEKPISEFLPEVEKLSNDFISENHEIQTYFDEKRPDRRWWVCSSFKMPCGGTHVSNTKEIGPIILKRKNLGSGKERIEIMIQ